MWTLPPLEKFLRTPMKLPAICKNKKMQAPKFYFLSSKSKLVRENEFDSHSSFKTHMGNKKAISASLPKPQEHTFTRWLEIAHWSLSPPWSKIPHLPYTTVYKPDNDLI